MKVSIFEMGQKITRRNHWVKRGVGLVLVGTIGLSVQTAHAATCGFVSIAGISFGIYDVFGGDVDSTGSLAYRCTGVIPGDVVDIQLTIGGGSSFMPRQMQNASHRLSYNIYLDAARTSIWGDGTGGTSRYGPAPLVEGVTVTVPTYGRIPSGQDPYVGIYLDTITAIMTF